MNDTVTYLVEATVGLVCGAAAIALWRSGRRGVGALLLIAGGAAIVHAVVALAF